MNIATEVAKASSCISMKVGSVIVKDNRIISTGYNGSPKGYYNCNTVHDHRGEAHSEWSNKYEIHAEENSILYAAKTGTSIDKATIYTTHQPCWQCLKSIVGVGINHIIYNEDYYRITPTELEEMADFCDENHVYYRKMK